MRILLCTPTYRLNGGGVSSYARDFFEIFSPEHSLSVMTGDDALAEELGEFGWQESPNDFSARHALQVIKKINDFSPDVVVNSGFALVTLISPFLKKEIAFNCLPYVLMKYSKVS